MSVIHECKIKTYSTDKGILHDIIYYDENGKFKDKHGMLTLRELTETLMVIDVLLHEEPRPHHDKLIEQTRNKLLLQHP